MFYQNLYTYKIKKSVEFKKFYASNVFLGERKKTILRFSHGRVEVIRRLDV